MNLCFLIGKIMEETKFNFICNKKQISVAKNSIELKNKSIIKVIGYNNIADFIYSKIKVNDNVFIKGILMEDNCVEIRYISII